ncbi:hypothetical protein H0H87_003818 [Tephrocybe sp. NHM501043]|nr:hypothetical protein H0H87_003818 [Tephrocybe sp. NHM501043]
MSKPLNYNLRWIERSFSTRPATEALLAPQRDAGHVSHADYDAALRFSAGHYPYYRFLGAVLSIPLTFALRRPSWSLRRTYGVLVATTVVGTLTGQAITLSAHLRFIRSLDDPSGFAQAIENIQASSGLPVPPGPVIVRPGNRCVDPTPIDSPPAPSISPPTKWDQIRAVNSRSSTASSWDTLRQNHERSRVPTTSDDTEAFQRSRDQDRAAEQARFNEMLDRERNFK